MMNELGLHDDMLLRVHHHAARRLQQSAAHLLEPFLRVDRFLQLNRRPISSQIIGFKYHTGTAALLAPRVAAWRGHHPTGYFIDVVNWSKMHLSEHLNKVGARQHSLHRSQLVRASPACRGSHSTRLLSTRVLANKTHLCLSNEAGKQGPPGISPARIPGC